MNIAPISQLNAPIVDPKENESEADKIQADFLKLLIAQISQQDPLNPQDASDFTAQLAQFASLEQLIGINQSIQAQSELQTLSIGANAASLIGKNAEVLGSDFGLKDGKADKIVFDQFKSSNSTEVRIFDSSGLLVHVEKMGSLPAATHEFVWDGKNGLGTQLPDGNYNYQVEARDLSGEPVDITALVVGRVTGIRFSGNSVFVNVGGREYPMSSVSAILESDSNSGSAATVGTKLLGSDSI